jgi:hypothetical protein
VPTNMLAGPGGGAGRGARASRSSRQRPQFIDNYITALPGKEDSRARERLERLEAKLERMRPENTLVARTEHRRRFRLEPMPEMVRNPEESSIGVLGRGTDAVI